MADILISVVVPMYNAEKYIGECLDSLLAQTFQNFEVITVDDCSSDNSVAVVASYAPKFKGRLKLAKMKKNSGGGGYVPRNVGLQLARGEYICFLDADDWLLSTALEVFYNAAEEYKAEVVYTGSYYDAKSPEDIQLHRDGAGKKLLKEGSEDKTDFRLDDCAGNLRRFLLEEAEGNFRNPWSKFIRRDFLIANEISFPSQMTTGGDFIWTINVYCHAKKFLRLPTPLYFYRTNTDSVTKTKREPSEQISHWVSAFLDFVKNLNALETKNKILSENPAYCLAAFKSHFEYFLYRTADARKDLSSQEIYGILHREFAKGNSDLSMSLLPFFLSFIDNERKSVAQLKNASVYPAISVIIPMYNAEKYFAECLDSLLIQTFQDFEVIIVDDCSTDKSNAIVNEYAPKFDGRLKRIKTEKNSGGGGYIPRNLGLKAARGEYVYFLDADDFILDSALETFYKAAKENDSDVVYSSVYFNMRKPNDIYLHRDGFANQLIEKGFEDKTELTIDDTAKLFQEFLASNEGNFRAPWSKFVRRDFLLKNEILFPDIMTGGDCVWVINVYAHARRFLRLPVPLYFYRRYSSGSITRKARSAQEQVAYWVSAFTAFLRALNELQNKTEILSENLNWCYEAVRDGHFEFCLYRTAEAREKLGNQEIYNVLYNAFAKNDAVSTIPFLFSVIDNEKKTSQKYLQTIDKLEREIEQLKNELGYRAVSVIIPLYNAGKFIGECLDSLLNQTFQSFEIIVVDDCSTDNSVAIVKSYAEKFGERLTVTATERNSGSGGLPRNKGLSLAKGEYVQFLDADDMLQKTALEEIYSLAKEYDADVIDCAKHYTVNEDGSDIQLVVLQKGELSDKPVFESKNFGERVGKIVSGFFTVSTCSKFVRRNLITKNEIFFPHVCPSEDDIWTYGLVFHANKFLHVPNAVYIRRLSESSVMRKERSPQQQLNFWLNPVLFGLKSLDDMMSSIEYFQKNPKQRYAVLKRLVKGKLNLSFRDVRELSTYEVYAAIKEKFGEKLGDCDVLISALCAAWYSEENSETTKATLDSDAETLRKFKRYFSARLDVKMLTANHADFRILSVSDDRAEIRKPEWFNRDGVGYVIQSYVGSLDIVFDVKEGGFVVLDLKGLFYPNPKDKSKGIPHWVDYTKFAVNNKVIFNEPTPLWHDAPYNYKFEAKAGEKIKISVEWLPHRSDT